MPETTGNVVIGQSLQLLTKIGVRYQGHLSAVDAEKRTITLNKVRCFGTEDRTASISVFPVQETFDQIEFSADNIAEMYVMPTLDEKKSYVLSTDPAVVSIEAKKHFSFQRNKYNQGKWHEHKEPLDRTYGSDRKWQNGQEKPQFTRYPAYKNGQADGSHKPGGSPRPVNNRGRQAFKPQPPNEASGEAPRLYKEAFDTSSKQFNSLYAIAQQVRGGSSSDGSAKPKYPKSKGVDEKAASSDLDKKYEKPSYGRPHGLGMPNNYRPSYGSPHATGKPPLWAPGGNRRNAYAGQKLKKFTSDYDFETANKKFEEITLSDEHDDPDDATAEPTPPKGENATEDSKAGKKKVFYEKMVFFDDISSDEKDRRSGKEVRPDWHSQRKTDCETFGPDAIAVVTRHANHNKLLQQQHHRVEVAAN